MISKYSLCFALVILVLIPHQSQTQSTEPATVTTGSTTAATPTASVSTTEATTTAGGSTTTAAGSNSTTESTTAASTTAPASNTTTAPPACQALTNCSLSDPPICGRLPTAICRRFRTICDLETANCAAQNDPLRTWTVVPMPSCSDLALGGTGQCGTGAAESRPDPRPECPPGPVECPTGGRKVCAISRNGQRCRMLVNSCALRNLNCQSEPRNNWVATSRSRCRNMCPGNEPERCTTNRYRVLLTVDDADE